jgi:dolichol-phosphate mannosyltransferase
VSGGSNVRVLVVTPTYNEVENVGDHITAVLGQQTAPDVLIVDDGSPDGTGARVEELVAAHPGRVDLIQRASKQGLGSAYVTGFRWALEQRRWDVVVQMDVDGSHDPASIGDLVAATSAADLALGSRYVSGGCVADWSWRRRALSGFGNQYARRVLGVPIRDLTGGFKAWRVDLLKSLDLGVVTAEGYAFQVETTYRAVQLGARVVEVPIVFRDRQHGASKMDTAIAAEAVTAVWRIRRRR